MAKFLESLIGRQLSLGMLLVAVALGLSGCVTRPEESQQFRDALPQEAVALHKTQSIAALGSQYTDPDNEFNILALSGGGAYGAYGVGFLNGWTERGTRPEFDVVTGVSTGALIAVYAFLGSQYDGVLKDVYVNTNESDIFTRRGVSGILKDSLYDNTPLKKRIEKYVTPKLLQAIAAEHAKGRRLYVATTNLDGGQLVVWDMGAIAQGGRTNPLQHFQKVLRASAAVPGFFPPVYIKPKRGVQLRQAHVDGGVKSPILMSDFIFSSKAKNKNIYVIANDNIAAQDDHQAVTGDLSSIARKTIATLTKELLIQNIYRGYARAVNSNTNFYLTAVPKKLGQGAQSLSFNQKFMSKLFEAGRKHAQTSKPWSRQPEGIRTFDVARR